MCCTRLGIYEKFKEIEFKTRVYRKVRQTLVQMHCTSSAMSTDYIDTIFPWKLESVRPIYKSLKFNLLLLLQLEDVVNTYSCSSYQNETR